MRYIITQDALLSQSMLSRRSKGKIEKNTLQLDESRVTLKISKQGRNGRSRFGFFGSITR